MSSYSKWAVVAAVGEKREKQILEMYTTKEQEFLIID